MQNIRKRLTADVFLNDVEPAVFAANIINNWDTRMMQFLEKVCFKKCTLIFRVLGDCLDDPLCSKGAVSDEEDSGCCCVLQDLQR